MQHNNLLLRLIDSTQLVVYDSAKSGFYNHIFKLKS